MSRKVIIGFNKVLIGFNRVLIVFNKVLIGFNMGLICLIWFSYGFNNFNMFKVLLLLSKVLEQLFDSSILT